MKSFDNEGAQAAACVGGAVFLVIGLGALWGELGFAAVVLPLSIIFIVRSVKSSNVVVDRSGVTTRSLFRTRRYPFQELREVRSRAVVLARTVSGVNTSCSAASTVRRSRSKT